MTDDLPAGPDGIKSDASGSGAAGASPAPRRGSWATLAVAAAALAGGALAFYGTSLRGGEQGGAAAHAGACARSLDAAAAIDPLARGDVAALTPARAPRDLSGVGFVDAAGAKTGLAAFKGRTVLLNLWAMWCVPCRAEMPALDQLQATAGSASFAVVPVDIDQTKLERARGFFKEIGAANLPYYADPSADILRTLAAKGLPTTVLVGADGCEIATLAGPAKWDSADARAVIAKATLAQTAAGKPPD